MRGFLALGDSYTVGEGVPVQEAWPAQLNEMLRVDGLDLESPLLVARTAWTTEELVAAIEQAPPQGTFPMVTLMIGVNDQYRGHPLDRFERSFVHLLTTAVGYADDEPHRVIALSIPDWGVTPFARDRDRSVIAAEVDRFNDAAQRRVATAGAHWHDVTESSRSMGADASLVAPDGLHAAGEMHRRWARSLHPVARTILSAD